MTFTHQLVHGKAIELESPACMKVNKKGTYEISWEVFPDRDKTAFGLFFTPRHDDEHEDHKHKHHCTHEKHEPCGKMFILCSNYGSEEGNVPYQGQVVTDLEEGILSLNRTDDNKDAELKNEVDGCTPVVSASIVIKRIC